MKRVCVIVPAYNEAIGLLTSTREITRKLTPLAKATMLATALLLILAISGALYLYYTPPEQNSIFGIQSRYFIPFMPLVLLPMMTNIPYKYQVGIKKTVITLLLVCLVVAVFVIVNRIYV